MGRRMRWAVALIVALLGLAALAAPAAASARPLPTALPVALPAAMPAGTDDFSFASWHSDFTLGLTPEGRSRLTTRETIVAEFPQIDQNHGLRRAIPTHYDGQPTSLTIRSVTDGQGNALPYETDDDSEDDGDFLVVTIAADEFVHGRTTYVITYTQENVTLYPDDADDEEFFWQVNGTGWAQPFGTVSATVHVVPDLAPRLTGKVACLQGGADSTDSCDDITTADTDDGGVLVEATAAGLDAHQGLAVVIGFTPGTFVPRDDSFTANPGPGIALAGALAALVAAVIAAIARVTRWANARGRGTIIPEYLPPTGVNLLVAGNISRTISRAIPAQLISLAVRGNVRVLEEGEDQHYLLEFRHADGVDETERSLLAHLFAELEPGALRDLSVKSAGLSTSMQGQLRLVPRQVQEAGLRARRSSPLRPVVIVGAIVAGLVAVIGGLVAVATEVGGAWPVLSIFVGIGAAVATFVLAASAHPLTPAGAELRDYLRGLKWYIDLAEADRLRVLQSPQGALRSPYRPEEPVPGTGRLQVVKLYERVLPYAVLFGEEKKWAEVLGEYYAETGARPDWYAGSGAFNAVYFATAIGAFSTSTTSAWAGSATSSTSSGFSGGAVGGGGGGGGGGGV